MSSTHSVQVYDENGAYICQDCGESYMDYLVPHKLWNRVMPDDGIVCFPCFDKRWNAEEGEQHGS